MNDDSIARLRSGRGVGQRFYLFIFCLLAMIGLGVVKTLISGGHPVPLVPPHPVAGATEALGIWLLARAFASGCTAMTGVEAVSNGVLAFKEPASVTARLTLTVVIGTPAVMLVGIGFLCKAYGIAATPPVSLTIRAFCPSCSPPSPVFRL